ncbi:MBL fold metallo-hydrolase [Calidifontibacillus erzurumensis]|uniref:MBL fold metallo-hydrolase n=1 Tax=Calidifontibacillus erzurumensis TaxID=2741433 RepID=UPI0035B50219
MEPIVYGNIKIFPVNLQVHHNLKSFNCYLVEKENSLYLIDAGIDSEDYWSLFVKTLKSNGFSLKDLTAILITHHHFDHVGLVNRITELELIPVYAHEKAIPRLKRDPEFLRKRVAFFEQLYREMGCGEAGEAQVKKLEHAIFNNKHLEIKADILPFKVNKFPFTVLEVPGHSPDQVAFYDSENKILFGGDLLIKHISSNALVEPDENGGRILSLLQHIESFQKCRSLSIDYVFSGHGKIIEQPIRLIEKRLENIDVKAEKILALIKQGVQTASEIAKAYYQKKYESQFSLVMSEIIGHLDYLEAKKQVKKKKIEGVWYYFV